MYLRFDLSFKKLKHGGYAYYRYSPMIGWAYIVDADERERLIAISHDQVTLALAITVALYGFFALGGPKVGGIAAGAGLFLLIVSGIWRTRRVLGDRKIERCEPAMSYPAYWTSLAKDMPDREIWRNLKNCLICALVASSLVYYGVEHQGIGYVLAGALVFVLVAIVGAITYYAMWIQTQKARRN